MYPICQNTTKEDSGSSAIGRLHPQLRDDLDALKQIMLDWYAIGDWSVYRLYAIKYEIRARKIPAPDA